MFRFVSLSPPCATQAVETDSDEGYATDEDPYARNYTVHSVAGLPVPPPRRPASAPAEPIAAEEEEEVRKSMLLGGLSTRATITGAEPLSFGNSAFDRS
jgi:hypothetical protein